MIGGVLAAAVLFAQAAPATPPQAAEPPKTAATSVSPLTVEGKKSAAEDGKTMQCHSEILLGSSIPRKVCARKEEFAERKREDQQRVREWQALRPYKAN